MSKKHSFALVYDHHERQGINELVNTYHQGHPSRKQLIPKAMPSRDRPLQLSSRSSRPRIRLQSSDELLRPWKTDSRNVDASSQTAHESSSYLKQACPWHEEPEPLACKEDTQEHHLESEEPVLTPPWRRKPEISELGGKNVIDPHVLPTFEGDPRVVRSISRSTDRSSNKPPSARHHQRRGTNDTQNTNDTAIWDPRPKTSDSQKTPAMTLLPVKKAPQPPLTPPLTPEVRSKSSQEAFPVGLTGLVPHPPRTSSLNVSDQTPSPAALPDSSSSGMVVASSGKTSDSNVRPQSHLGHTSPPPRAPQRRSSLRAPTSPPKTTISGLDLAESAPESTTAPMPTSPSFSVNSRHSLDSLDLEADLTPLPPDLTSDPEFLESFPWSQDGPHPHASRILRYEDGTTPADAVVRESFDSVAPPPIALGRVHEGVRKPNGAPLQRETVHIGPTAANRWNKTRSQGSGSGSGSGSSNGGGGARTRGKLTKVAPPINCNTTPPASSSSTTSSALPFRSLQRSGYPTKDREALLSPPSTISTIISSSGSGSGSNPSARTLDNGSNSSRQSLLSKHLFSSAKKGGSVKRESLDGASSASSANVGGMSRASGSRGSDRPLLGARTGSAGKVVNIGGKSYTAEQLYRDHGSGDEM